MTTRPIPKDTALDGVLRFSRDKYGFLQQLHEETGSEVFQTRLLGMSVIGLHGEEAATLFYDPTRFVRAGAVPTRVQKTLMGERSVQTLDGEAHRRRKAAFMALMSRERLDELMSIAWNEWHAAAAQWAKADQTSLFEASQDVLCRAVCAWAGVPLADGEVRTRASDFGAMVDSFAAIGPRHGAGRAARARAEAWLEQLVTDARRGDVTLPENTAAHAFTFGAEGLPARVAAVEIINVLRPTVAVAYYVTFGALALHRYPAWRERLRQDGVDGALDLELFVQEVRRYYPFAPAVGARVRETFEWKGFEFPGGRLVLLDLYGANHDAKVWGDPNVFRPDRFKSSSENPFVFMPQGGGDHATGHRCAGEWITIELMKEAMRFLAQSVEYTVPEQDLRIPLAKLPTLPNSGFVIRDVRAVGAVFEGAVVEGVAAVARPLVTRPEHEAA